MPNFLMHDNRCLTAFSKSGELQKAVDQLFSLEKQTRNVRVSPFCLSRPSNLGSFQAADLASTTRIAKAVTGLCYEARDYDLLNSSILILSKKHGQLKGVVKAIVEQAMEWLEEIKTLKGIPTWLQLVETLRSVTEGKV